ncbi:MAG: NfeD family protein [Oscillospiraceae bacterium]
MNIAAWCWLAVCAVFIVIEASTAQLVSVWFVGGSLVALVSALLGAPTAVQIILFAAVSGILLACIYPIVKKKLVPKRTATNADMVIGKIGYVTEQIDNDAGKGRAHANGLDWTARSHDGAVLEKDEKVKVFAIDGVKLIVTKLTEEK